MSEPMEHGNLALTPTSDRHDTVDAAVDQPVVAAIPSRIRKRDGQIVTFDADKILSAVRRAGAATGEFGEDEAWLLTAQVVKVLSHRFIGQIRGDQRPPFDEA